MWSPIVCILNRGTSFRSRQGLCSLTQIIEIDSRFYSFNSRSHIQELPGEQPDKLKGAKWKIMENFDWLREVAPAFPVDGDKVTIIHEPSVFYTTLVERCKNAERRISLASLYLGAQQLEEDLVKSIRTSIDATNGNIKINILLDYMRGSRGKINSRKMLLPLLDGTTSENCNLFFYHTPQLRGISKAIIPQRYNELIGLQHMKIYICDDSLIISGANLSNDYFTNRQDRYFLIEDCKELCDFYDELIQRVSAFSFRLTPGDIMSYSSESLHHPLRGSVRTFKETVREKIQSLSLKAMGEFNSLKPVDSDTWIFPLIQMGTFNIHQDSEVTLNLLKTAPPGSLLRIATSYLNLTSEYREALIRHCEGTCELLTAHPSANGFFGAKGVAGGIPAAYTLIEKSFFKEVERRGLDHRIKLREYIRPGWTYHAKGLWYTLPSHKRPCFTLIGSSNFGYRSVKRDLECQIGLVTRNEGLQEALEYEHNRLFKKSEPVTTQTFNQRDRIPPTWDVIVVPINALP
ncbi:CDP-diacylglycerol--glycerol-3-phosphate 3-phosphatidyltransferase, mitochondrial isoform X2 [Fopius arisanus]|uniref:CDP-diacylglycerol--glycerol-3-phosphate 3-phosphatidyltransferase n=1 Tax=Fopius arisanus TaxID=64838 RepID=A0A9R1SWM6_9HYME|nr:PREDICTED: CDP-diacylglycerol--glycerol-3-phosphate 3-phosphatidyltransferase, mitochondrial isoform X2 [Fopius arisanus]